MALGQNLLTSFGSRCHLVWYFVIQWQLYPLSVAYVSRYFLGPLYVTESIKLCRSDLVFQALLITLLNFAYNFSYCMSTSNLGMACIISYFPCLLLKRFFTFKPWYILMISRLRNVKVFLTRWRVSVMVCVLD